MTSIRLRDIYGRHMVEGDLQATIRSLSRTWTPEAFRPPLPNEVCMAPEGWLTRNTLPNSPDDKKAYRLIFKPAEPPQPEPRR